MQYARFSQIIHLADRLSPFKNRMYAGYIYMIGYKIANVHQGWLVLESGEWKFLKSYIILVFPI